MALSFLPFRAPDNSTGNRPLKILHIISSVNPVGGGPIEAVRQLASVSMFDGHEVEVASLDTPDAPYVKKFPLPIHLLGPGTLTYGFSPRFVPWLRENAKNYDAVIVNGLWQYHSFGTWRALRNCCTPYFVFTHGMLDPWFARTYPLKHLKKWMYWPWGEYPVLRDARAVLFTCEEERVLARQSFRLYRCNEVVVNLGTASPTGDPQAQERAFYDRFPHVREKRLALFMGRIHPKKGCDLAIQAFAKVLAKDPNWHLVMAGPDQVGWQSKLSSLAEQLKVVDRITWAGMIRGDEKWGAFRASEIFVLPSHQENFGFVVAEALACGVPALISNKVNIWREVEGDGAAFVAEDDLPGTCHLFESWLNARAADRQRMRAQARKCFEQRFEIRRAADGLCQVLSNVGADRASRYAIA
jgi:glycosyltransferase involved in cell wall biosynthesis